MPVAWEIEQSVIVVSTIGHYRGSELLHAIEEATRRTPGLPLLFDSRAAQGYLTPQEIGRRTQWIAGAHRQGLISRCAVLVPRDPYRVEIADLSATDLRRLGVETLVFTDRNDAFRWLKGARPRAPAVRPSFLRDPGRTAAS